MNKFSFHPVGQGLFYTGSILNGHYNFVYDCGKSINDKNFIEIIENYTDKIKQIDFIVISHLHNDHYNGLPYLLDLCKRKNIKINKIILPYLYGFKNVAHLLLALNIYEEDEYFNIDEYNQLFKLMCSFYNGNKENEYEISIEFIAESENELSKYEFNVPEVSKPFWKFHLLNKKIPYSICNQINCEITNLLNSYKMYDLIQFISKYKNDALRKIEKIYHDALIKSSPITLFNNLNLSSIVMIHYPLIETGNAIITNKEDFYFNKHYEKNRYLYCRNKCIDIIRTYVSLSLLTGDAEFDNFMVNYVKNLMNEKSAIMQVPHHGSKKNYKQVSGLFNDFDFYAISFGLGNNYNHPSSITINSILSSNNRATIYEVNQLTGLYYYIY